MCTRQSRKVIWDIINTLFLTTVAVKPTFVAFLQRSQTRFHGLSCQFFQISLKNSELKTTHDTFRGCRVHFIQQPFSKQLYLKPKKGNPFRRSLPVQDNKGKPPGLAFLKDTILQHSLYTQPGSTKYWRSVLNTLSDAIKNKFTPLRDDAHPLP